MNISLTTLDGFPLLTHWQSILYNVYEEFLATIGGKRKPETLLGFAFPSLLFLSSSHWTKELMQAHSLRKLEHALIFTKLILDPTIKNNSLKTKTTNTGLDTTRIHKLSHHLGFLLTYSLPHLKCDNSHPSYINFVSLIFFFKHTHTQNAQFQIPIFLKKIWWFK